MKLKLTILFSLFYCSFSFAQGFVVDSVISNITISKNGTATVNEKIYADFSESKRGIVRFIPYKFKNEGSKYTTDISGLKCNNNEYKVSSSNGNKVIKIGNKHKYITGKQYYDISYDIEGPFITSETYQEFYWNITGNKWDATINNVKFNVYMPDDVQIRYNNLKVFTGREGEKNVDATITQKGNIISGFTTKAIYPGEGLTIAVKLPQGYITGKTMEVKKERVQPNIPLSSQWPMGLLPLGLIAALFAFWRKMKGSKEETSAQTDDLAYYPPLELNSAEVGAFMDGFVHDRDIISLLPFWANQGFVKVEQYADGMYFHKLKVLDEGRPDYEYELFNEIFKSRNMVSLEDIKYNFATIMWKSKSKIKNEIIDLKLYDDNYRYWFRSWRWWIMIVLFLPLIVLSFAYGYWMAAIGFMLCIIAIIIFGSLNQRKSNLGINIQKKINAFYNFMKLNDDKKFQEVANADPLYFEKVYPYAVAMNLDKSFTQRMRTVRTASPFWYMPYYVMGSHNNNNGFEQFTVDYSPKEITSAFTSTQSTGGSSGGGFSGGGFSGGGFGGGGGGSW